MSGISKVKGKNGSRKGRQHDVSNISSCLQNFLLFSNLNEKFRSGCEPEETIMEKAYDDLKRDFRNVLIANQNFLIENHKVVWYIDALADEFINHHAYHCISYAYGESYRACSTRSAFMKSVLYAILGILYDTTNIHVTPPYLQDYIEYLDTTFHKGKKQLKSSIRLQFIFMFYNYLKYMYLKPCDEKSLSYFMWSISLTLKDINRRQENNLKKKKSPILKMRYNNYFREVYSILFSLYYAKSKWKKCKEILQELKSNSWISQSVITITEYKLAFVSNDLDIINISRVQDILNELSTLNYMDIKAVNIIFLSCVANCNQHELYNIILRYYQKASNLSHINFIISLLDMITNGLLLNKSSQELILQLLCSTLSQIYITDNRGYEFAVIEIFIYSLDRFGHIPQLFYILRKYISKLYNFSYFPKIAQHIYKLYEREAGAFQLNDKYISRLTTLIRLMTIIISSDDAEICNRQFEEIYKKIKNEKENYKEYLKHILVCNIQLSLIIKNNDNISRYITDLEEINKLYPTEFGCPQINFVLLLLYSQEPCRSKARCILKKLGLKHLQTHTMGFIERYILLSHLELPKLNDWLCLHTLLHRGWINDFFQPETEGHIKIYSLNYLSEIPRNISILRNSLHSHTSILLSPIHSLIFHFPKLWSTFHNQIVEKLFEVVPFAPNDEDTYSLTGLKPIHRVNRKKSSSDKPPFSLFDLIQHMVPFIEAPGSKIIFSKNTMLPIRYIRYYKHFSNFPTLYSLHEVLQLMLYSSVPLENFDLHILADPSLQHDTYIKYFTYSVEDIREMDKLKTVRSSDSTENLLRTFANHQMADESAPSILLERVNFSTSKLLKNDYDIDQKFNAGFNEIIQKQFKLTSLYLCMGSLTFLFIGLVRQGKLIEDWEFFTLLKERVSSNLEYFDSLKRIVNTIEILNNTGMSLSTRQSDYINATAHFQQLTELTINIALKRSATSTPNNLACKAILYEYLHHLLIYTTFFARLTDEYISVAKMPPEQFSVSIESNVNNLCKIIKKLEVETITLVRNAKKKNDISEAQKESLKEMAITFQELFAVLRKFRDVLKTLICGESREQNGVFHQFCTRTDKSLVF